LNDRWSFKITGGAYTQDAFGRPQGAMPNQFHTPYPAFTNQGTTLPKVNGRVDYDLPDGKQHFRLEGGYASKEGINYGGLGPWAGHAKDSYGKADYVRGSLKITGYASFSYDVNLTNPLFFGPDGKNLRIDGKLQTYDIDFANSSAFQAKHLISYGGNFRHDGVDTNITTSEGKNRNSGGAYVQDEFLISKHFRWIFGARIDKFDWLEGPVLSPRTTFMVKPAQGHTLRLSYNRAYLAPPVMYDCLNQTGMLQLDLSLIDPQLAGSYFSYPIHLADNRDLKEQSLNAYEVGYSAIVAKGRVSLGAAFYINDSKKGFATMVNRTYTSQNPPPNWPLPPFVLDAMIAAGAGLPAEMTYRNLGKVRNRGLELNADARFSRYLTGYANYSWQARPESTDFDVSSLLNLPPAHRFNAGMNFDYKHYLGDVSVSHVGSAYWNDVIAVQYSGATDACTTVNLSGGVRWGDEGRYTLMAKISNLANTPVQNHIFGDILKRQITGEYRMRF
jgi:outer membrane receptor protein involved in Fe transport